jgi:antitoxin-like ribbon-helix-helix protein
MAKSSLATLRNALREKPTQVEAAEPAVATAGAYKAPSRAGKLHISAWLSADYKTSLRAIQMKHPDKTLQTLLSEALNDLYAKYNVPVVREE